MKQRGKNNWSPIPLAVVMRKKYPPVKTTASQNHSYVPASQMAAPYGV